MSTTNFQELFRSLAFFENLVYNNEESFANKFCTFGNETCEIISVSFSTTYVHLKMMDIQGRHFVNQISWSDVQAWIDEDQITKSLTS